jgi:hypothetical protein
MTTTISPTVQAALAGAAAWRLGQDDNPDVGAVLKLLGSPSEISEELLDSVLRDLAHLALRLSLYEHLSRGETTIKTKDGKVMWSRVTPKPRAEATDTVRKLPKGTPLKFGTLPPVGASEWWS